MLPSFSNQEWFLLENNIAENQWKIAEIIYIPFQKVHVWPVLQLPKALSFLSLILFPTWFVVNDINFWFTKDIQWMPRRHKVLTHGQERLFRKVTSVSIHSFVEWLDTFSYVLRPTDVTVKEVTLQKILYSFPVVLLWNTCACCNWRQHRIINTCFRSKIL